MPGRSEFAARYVPHAIAATIVGLFAAFALAKGIPAMRHDWWMPSDPQALKSATFQALSTWRDDGMGGPVLYPNDYFFYAFALLLELVLPPVAVLGAIVCVTGAVAWLAARAFSGAQAPPVLPLAILAIVLFNPWTYTELVAGHLPMLVSYAAMAWFAAECTKGKAASPWRLALAMVLIAQQLQFLVIAIPAAALLLAVRGIWQPLLAGVLVALPVGIGVALGYHDLQQIPYTLDWEKNQSLHFPAAATLRGYFAHYDDALGKLSASAGAALALLALVSAALVRSRTTIAIAIAVAIAIVATLGSNGPAAPLYDFAVTHVKPTALFRELYDLVATIVIGYVALVAAGARECRYVAPIAGTVAVLAIAAWTFSPPARFWVPSSSIPVSQPDVPRNARFALLPAFQPLQFEGRGSGTDPDVFVRPGNAAPLNSYLPLYPAATALARYAAGGDSAMLRALSVSQVVSRPWLCTDEPSLRAQAATRAARVPACARSDARRSFGYAPELGIAPSFAIGTLDGNVGAGNVLAIDAARAGLFDARALETIAPAPGGGTDPSVAWTDARLFFASHPAFGQSYGGVYTTSPQPLPVPTNAGAMLALVEGTIADADGAQTIAHSTAGTYRWIPLTHPVDSVRCTGECVVAAFAPSTFGLPLDPPGHDAANVDFDARLPWLIVADLPPASAGSMIRYNATYSPYWTWFGPDAGLRHVRVDGAVNGWIATRALPAAAHAYLIEVRSAGSALAEIVAALGLIALFSFAFRARSAA